MSKGGRQSMEYITKDKTAYSKLKKLEINRKHLVNKVLNSHLKYTYIQAGAGYGKTTLLSQIAASARKTVWLSLTRESDVFTFVSSLSEAIKRTFPSYDFTLSEYFAFEEKGSLLSEELTNSMRKLMDDFTIIFDDLYIIKNKELRALITYFLNYIPEHINIILSSREAPWKELLPLYIRENFLEIKQDELSFTREEVSQILGFDNDAIYKLTEGWPLAVISFKILIDSGISQVDIPFYDNETLYSYLFHECISCLPSEVVDFLLASACLDELDSQMLNHVLKSKNSGVILENLVIRNLFTVKSANGLYRYHALFKNCLLKASDKAKNILLQKKAAQFYIDKKDYPTAAEYAIRIQNTELLETILLACYREYMRNGNYNQLRVWFGVLEDTHHETNSKILVAKGAYLSSIGNFTGAKTCLDAAIPLLKDDSKELYIEAMLHKARVYRNYISFEESNLLLDELIAKLDNPASELAYDVIIEKLYNLCWNSNINEAYTLVQQSIEACARAGSLKVRDWFQRYLCTIYFFMGRMKEAVYYYEKSLELPENELQYLDLHGIGIYAAKAYQMLGDRDRSLAIITDELQRLKSTGKYEEMWFGYLFAAEIYYQNSFIDSMNGESVSYETTKQYFTLANEYAPLYRKTDFQMQWVKMLRLTYSLIFSNTPQIETINEIFISLDKSSNYLKCIILARLFGYYAAVSDYPNAVRCAKLCIEAGEKANMLLHSTLAYGILARAILAAGNTEAAEHYIRRYLQLCYELGINEYFRMEKCYEPIIKFAFNKGIEPEATRFMIDFAGYKTKKAYIKTLGGFAVFPYGNMKSPIKMRTRKERELLAFLLNAGKLGVTKEQIYSAIWSESESDNIKKLIGVNLCQLKKDLLSLGISDAIQCNEKHYRISMEEIECDYEIFEEAAARFEANPNREEALKLISLYSCEYLCEFEALWAIPKKLYYRDVYEKATIVCL